MFNIIDRFMSNLTINQVQEFAISKNINLSDEELSYLYTFLKKNYKDVLNNPNLFDINRYQNHFSSENFIKIKKVYTEYFSKYHKFL